MEITIERDVFLEALQLIVSISPKSSTAPIIDNALLETNRIDGEDYFRIRATNYDKSFLGNFKANVIKPGRLCLNTARLFNLVREFREPEIQISSTPQNWVFLVCGRSTVKLPSVDSGLFPVIEFEKLPNRISISGDALKMAIDRTFFTIGENEARKNLMGLNLQKVDGKKIRWIGADGFRISQFFTELERETEAKGNIIIPKGSLTDIRKILAVKKEDVEIGFDENEFQVTSQFVKFKTRLIEADFPNLNSLTDSVGEITLKIPKEEFVNAIKIIGIMTEEKPHAFVKLTFREGKLCLQSEKLDSGESDNEISCDYTGKEIKTALNVRFLLEALTAFDSSPDDHILINLSESTLPLSIFCEEWKNFKTILMPIDIK